MKNDYKHHRLAALLMAALTATAAVSPSAFADAQNGDLDGHWSEESFIRMEDAGIINGYEDGTYRPDGTITRAEFFALINRVCNSLKNFGSSFTDVDDSAWYKSVVDYAYGAQYASGDGNGEFRPESGITRCEAASAVYKAFGGAVGGSISFADGGDIPSWSLEAVQSLVAGGIMTGYDEDNTFRPNDLITRAESVTLLGRIAGTLIKNADNTEAVTYSENAVVGVSNVIFRDCTFEGDVYLAAGIYGGEVRFINCKLNGNVYFSARGGATVVFENTDCDCVTVNSPSVLGVISTGESVIDKIYAVTDCSISEMNTEKGFTDVIIYDTCTLEGTFENVEAAEGCTGFTLTDGEIENCTANSSASPQINITGTLKNLDAVKSCTVNGQKVSAGSQKEKLSSEANENVKLSYTLSQLTNGGDASDITGVSRTEAELDAQCLLDNITVSTGELSPEFSPETADYTLYVKSGTSSVKITPEGDELLTLTANGSELSGGYTVSDISDGEKTVAIDVYKNLILRNTYTVTIVGYGTSDASIKSVSADKACTVEKSSDGYTYTVTLTGELDYSSGEIPVTLTVEPLNSASEVAIGGETGAALQTDMYDQREKEITVTVTSEDKTAKSEYTIKLVRPIIDEVDNPDSEAVELMISEPSQMTAELLEKAKITDVSEDKISKYASYLEKTAYHADGEDVFGKQSVIQNAVDVVNEWDGTILRVEVENYWTGTVKSFADDETQKYIIGVKSWTLSLDDLGIPEGIYNMTLRWANKYQYKGNPVYVNDEVVYDGKIPKEWVATAVTNGTLTSDKLSDTQIEGISLADSENTITFTESGSNLVMDYFELEMQFD